MTQSEHKIADFQGQFAQFIKDGNRVGGSWIRGRILLSNRRLILVGNEGKRVIPLSEIDAIGDRQEGVELLTGVPNYISIRFDDDVLLVAAPESFEVDLYRALLDQRVILVRHPAVSGGVVQDTTWTKGQLKVESERLTVAMADGNLVEISFGDVGSITVGERTVVEEKRQVIEVEHTEEGTSVQTYLSGSSQQCSVMESLLRLDDAEDAEPIDLDDEEREVLMALYSGVSSFEVEDFLDMEVDQVEEIFDRLIEHGVIEEVRTRREVSLKPRGRSLASEAMNEQ